MSIDAVRLPIAVLCAWLSFAASAQENRTQGLVEQALKLAPHRDAGARTYVRFCASCHGADAHGNPETVTPSLAGQLTSYLVRELVDMGEGNRVATDMHRLIARKELTSAQALRDVASYLAALPRMAAPQTGNGRNLQTGKRIFDAECAQCHGFDAEADASRGVPMLQAQHYAYLLLQSRQMPVSHGYDVGVETLERFEDLKLEELEAVCDYLSRMAVKSAQDRIALR